MPELPDTHAVPLDNLLVSRMLEEMKTEDEDSGNCEGEELGGLRQGLGEASLQHVHLSLNEVRGHMKRGVRCT